jgi:protein phosphatase
MRLKFAGLTDVGRTRENNEDNFFVSDEEALCVVADGMGGHSSGEIASAFALRAIKEWFDQTRRGDNDAALARAPAWPFKRRPPNHPDEKRLVQAFLLANEIVFSYSQRNSHYRGMGTTLVGAYFIDTGVFVAHIGDSRAYRLRDGQLERITRDHSLADEYASMGLLSGDQVRTFAYKNVVTRAVGLGETVEPEVHFHTIRQGDVFLLCSDGLTDPLTDEAIREILLRNFDQPELACRVLVDAANAAGGPDNITVVVARTL